MEAILILRKFCFKLFLIIIYVIFTTNLTACEKKQNNKGTSKVNTNINEISKLINLPYRPISVSWQTTEIGDPNDMRVPGPADWSLDAVLLFSKSQVKDILSKSKKIQDDSKYLLNTINKNLLEKNDVMDKEVYQADIFAKTPLLDGIIVRIKNTNKLFVSLQTK
jgi:hypothetical protein